MKLLVVVDNWVGQSVIKPWLSRVKEEGKWDVVTSMAPNSSGYNDINRPAKVNQIRQFIRDERPDAVQIIGSVGIPASGHFSPDGHLPRTFWGPTPYMSYEAPTDNIQFIGGETQAWSTNGRGDGRYDQQTVFAEVPVAVIDFGNIESLLPNQLVPSGPRAGQQVYPAIDWHAATQDYFARNLAYRTGATEYPERGLIQGGLYKDADRIKMKADNSRVKAWDERPDVIGSVADRYFLAFHSLASEHWYHLVNAGYSGAVIENVCRSYGMEYFRKAAQRRRLEWCLASLWGRPGAWVVKDAHADLYDVVKHRMERNPIFPVSDYVVGDITLPISKPKQEATICPTCNGKGTVSL